jgi:hypothetical protein
MKGPDNVTAITLLKLVAEKLEEPIAHEDLPELHGLVTAIATRVLSSHHHGCDPDARAAITALNRATYRAVDALRSVERISSQTGGR